MISPNLHLGETMRVDRLNVVLVLLVEQVEELVLAEHVALAVVTKADDLNPQLLNSKGHGDELVLDTPRLDPAVVDGLEALRHRLEVISVSYGLTSKM